LLAAGAAPTELPDRAASLLVAAVVANEPELVDALLAKGAASSQQQGPDEASAFLVAVEVGSYEIFQSFLKRAVNLDINAGHGGAKRLTALHAAAARGRADVVKALIAANALVDPTDADGRTPLHHAAHGDHDDVLRVLVSAGAAIRHLDNDGLSPLKVAQAANARSAESALAMAESVIPVAGGAK